MYNNVVRTYAVYNARILVYTQTPLVGWIRRKCRAIHDHIIIIIIIILVYDRNVIPSK